MFSKVAYIVFAYLRYFQVSDTKWVTEDENMGLLKSEVCSDKCPNFCGSWEVFNGGQWEEDPTFTIKCKGWYIYV